MSIYGIIITWKSVFLCPFCDEEFTTNELVSDHAIQEHWFEILLNKY